MTDKIHPHEPDYLACKVCLEEIPISVSASHEGDEYTQHYCGIECYTLWKSEQDQASDNSESSD